MKVHSDDEGSAILDPWMTRCKDARGFLLLQRGGEEGGHRPSGEKGCSAAALLHAPGGGPEEADVDLKLPVAGL